MGTWGSGPFDTDAAQDLLEQLEEVAASERRAELERLFGQGEPGPDEVLAGAALVAAILPGGVDLPWAPEVAGLLPEQSAEQLRGLALDALDVALAPGNWWWKSWVDRDDQARMRSTVDRVRVILIGG